MNRFSIPMLFCFIAISVPFAFGQEEWRIVASDESWREEGINLAFTDLAELGKSHGIRFEKAKEQDAEFARTILVGDASRNRRVEALAKKGLISMDPNIHPEGYRIATIENDGKKILVVAGGSIQGDIYGLYWIWDRLRVLGTIPDLNLAREPDLQIRYTRRVVNNKEDIRRALRYGLNTVYGENPLRLVPWNAEPERTENEKFREQTRELAAYAHSVHLKILAMGTEFTYHPSILQEFGATLSPSDPCFWNAVQAKFRRLFQAMPELDGVCSFTGEEQSYWGNYTTFDPMHFGENCDWSLEKRYRTYVKMVANVVVGEFDKLLFQRTWNTNCYEQQSQPDIYRRTFTDDVPMKNLYLIPSFTQNDRWWYQRYNPTVNITPHNMMVVLETMDYHAGGNVFPTFPGPYYQGGLQTMLDVKDSNLKGASFDMPGEETWNTEGLTAYTASRLEWDHNEDVRMIAEDFASIYFGRDVAKEMADICLMSPVAYKYGLYIEPVAYGFFNSLPLIRVGMFVAPGYPSIDGGKEHVEFLRKIYLSCKPWIAETLSDLDHGLETAKQMQERYRAIQPRVTDREFAENVANSLEITRLLILTNNLYVKTFFAYFGYRENPIESNRVKLSGLSVQLKSTLDQFKNTPGFHYQLFGIEQLLKNVGEMLADREKAETRLAKAPSRQEIEIAVAEQQKRYAEVLEQYAGQAVQVLHLESRVDGMDVLSIRGNTMEIEHLLWDNMYFSDSKILNPLPVEQVTVIPKDIESRPMHPFILEQPSEKNNFTAKVYLNDMPGGAGWCKFDLYYIPKPPEDLGLKISWQE